MAEGKGQKVFIPILPQRIKSPSKIMGKSEKPIPGPKRDGIKPIPGLKRNGISWEEFLASYPPGKRVAVVSLTRGEAIRGQFNRLYDKLRAPDIELYCDNSACNGRRFFEEMDGTLDLRQDHFEDIFLTYQCRNCQQSVKSFAVRVKWSGTGTRGEAIKYGEMPPFGPHVPSRVISLIREDKELFNMGQRAESQGMGVGAFAYYRRVVENEKGKIIDEIIRVAERIKAPEKSIERLKSARDERQFKKAVESVKDAIPEVLLIDGHNPLTLLHDALSEGIHAQTDKECLELATSIRTILTELAERLGEALKDQAELGKAVKRLLKFKSEKVSKEKKKSQFSQKIRKPK